MSYFFQGASDEARHRSVRFLQAIVVAFTAAAFIAAPQAQATNAPTVEVIVQKLADSGTSAEAAVIAAGGKVAEQLPIINGFVAKVPTSTVGSLHGAPGVAHVTADEKVHVQSSASDDATAATADEVPSVFQDEIGATDLKADGVSGNGVTVALIDTGVSNVADLQGRIVPVRAQRGNLRECVNFSGESSCKDTYGHGTFIAGLIAGTGTASEGKFTGVAPGAKILSLKIAGADGSAPVSKILAALQWVIDHRSEYGIKVLNLSLGTDSTTSYRHDPLNRAVEQAWNNDMSVVVSAGNRGPGAGTISKPADDPMVITVGAVDDLGTPALSDDILPDFSSRGPTVGDGLTKPDIAAPGGHVISVRAPGSKIEQQFPGGGIDDTYRRGSGTSMATGIVSGAIALLEQQHPEWTPGQIKSALVDTAVSAASTDRNSVGRGVINLPAATAVSNPGDANSGVQPSDGTGPLSLSQGTVGVAAVATGLLGGVVGGVSNLLKGADSSEPSGGSWYGTKWNGGSWYGGSWYGGSWYGGSWYGGSWYGGSWYGGSWYGGSWYGGSWYGAWN